MKTRSAEPAIDRHPTLRVLAVYVLLAVLLLPALTWTLASRVAVGDGSGDSFDYLWGLWWVKQAVLHGKSLFQTDLLYWPETTSLLFHGLTPVNGFISLPVQLAVPGVAGLVASLNVVTLASFALTGLATHLIARDEGASDLGAWEAGFIAMSLPYRFWHLNHLNLLSTQWGLFTLLFFARALRRPTAAPIAATGLCAMLTTHSDFESAAYTVLAGLMLLVWHLASAASKSEALRLVRTASLCAAAALVFHLPFIRLLLLQRADPPVAPSASEAEWLSANFVGLFLPGPISLFGRWTASYLPKGHGLSGDEVFLGAVFPAMLAWLAVRRGNRAMWRWMTMGAVFLVLALGPSLHVGGTTLLRNQMPYAWLVWALPSLGMSRSPVRMAYVAGVFFAIALGVAMPRLGVGEVFRWRRGRFPRLVANRRVALVGLGALLLVLERYPRFFPATVEVHVPQAYMEMAADPAVYAIMPVPTDYYHRQVYMFWQTVHGKPITAGFVSRRTVRSGRWMAAYRAARTDAARLALLRSANIRYIVEHTADTTQLLRENPRLIPVAPAPD